MTMMPLPSPPVPTPGDNMGRASARYESHAKVTGQAIYAADLGPERPAYAFLAIAGIAKGRITAIDDSAARRVPGVIEIFTHLHPLPRTPSKHMTQGGRVSDSVMPLVDAAVHHDGQIIGMVVADSYEAAREAGYRLKFSYAEIRPSAGFDAPGADEVLYAAVSKQHKDKAVGDFGGAYAAAPVKIDARYSTPAQHHNPIELFSTTAAWHGDELTIWEPSQFVYSLKYGVAEMIGIDPAKVRVIDPFVGGAFGSKGIMTQRTALVAAAARALHRPVKLVVTRDQGFTTTTYRAETRHHIRMAADKAGKLQAYSHEGWEVSSRADDYAVGGTENSVEIYAVPNVASKVHIVHADRNTPGFMRSPPETPYIYALESAIDEMAHACGIDPVEFRRLNDTMVSPINGAPYTSRSLMKCFDAAAASFGWDKRQSAPGTHRDGEWLVGFGCATAVYPTNMMPSTARVRMTADGHVLVQVAAHDVGTGAYTVMQNIAAERLGIAHEHIRVEMGDTDLPPGNVAGGSMTTASSGSAVKAACDKIALRFGNRVPEPAALKDAFTRLGTASIEEYAEYAPPSSGVGGIQALYRGQMGGSEGQQQKGEDNKKPLMMAFGANFVEVRVHARTREIRVPRMTGAFAAGRIVNPRTARSQYLGGMIWGLGAALLEETQLDRKRARYVNDNIAEYLIAVNADVPHVDIILVPETDTQVNPLGVKGIGELANVGMPAAIASAVFNATGKRIRDLPITIDKLI